MIKQRFHSIEFKRQVAQEFIAGEPNEQDAEQIGSDCGRVFVAVLGWSKDS